MMWKYKNHDIGDSSDMQVRLSLCPAYAALVEPLDPSTTGNDESNSVGSQLNTRREE
jgi:hypothetical protein